MLVSDVALRMSGSKYEDELVEFCEIVEVEVFLKTWDRNPDQKSNHA
jgi:hypothetical protein